MDELYLDLQNRRWAGRELNKLRRACRGLHLLQVRRPTYNKIPESIGKVLDKFQDLIDVWKEHSRPRPVKSLMQTVKVYRIIIAVAVNSESHTVRVVSQLEELIQLCKLSISLSYSFKRVFVAVEDATQDALQRQGCTCHTVLHSE